MKRTLAALAVACLIFANPLAGPGAAAQSPERPDPLEGAVLDILKNERILVSVHLINGVTLEGYIQAHGPAVIYLKDIVSQVVYKRAISTIVPSREIVLP